MLHFETTQWTLVVAAADQGSAEAQQALGQLCEKYWQPLFEYARRRSRDEATASDSVQAFIASLIEKDSLKVADAERGKFRSFLIVSFKRFLSQQFVYFQAQKRGGGQPVISLDQREEGDRKMEPADSLTAEQEFQRQWARTVLQLVMKQLEEEYREQDKLAQTVHCSGRWTELPIRGRPAGDDCLGGPHGHLTPERPVSVPVAAGDCSNRGQ